MAIYQYRGLNEAGRKVRGEINANNEIDLYQRLKTINVELISSKVQTARRAASLFGRKIENRDLIQMCLHLQQLQAAGVGLLESLADVREATEQRRLRDLTAEIYQDVSEGASLSEAYGKHPKVFGTVFQSLVAAGEASGNLTESFVQLVKHLKWVDDVNSKIKKAIRYPTFMLVVMLGLFFFMMTFVVPQVTSFLLSNGQQLPFITLALIATSRFVQEFWWVLFGVPVATIIVLRALAGASQGMAYRVDQLKLKLPMFGPVLRKIALSRFAHFFATMFGSGLPILECLETAQKVVGNRVLARSLGNVQVAVQQGTPLSTGLRDTNEFPSLVIRMVRIGEESGNLSDTLENVTDFYDRDVNESVEGMVAMLEPTMTIFAGALMGWIVVGVIGPIYDTLGKVG
jgi:type IV pilus assembly protein PilC